MNGLTVCAYNVGGVTDYFQLCKHLNPSEPSLNFKSREEEAAFRLRYNEVENQTTQMLIGEAQVYCLQEVGEEERPLIRALKERNFEIIHLEGVPAFDTAIALDKTQFRDIAQRTD